MKKHRFIGDFDLSNKKVKSSDKEIINQLRNVLRIKVGDEVILGDGQGNQAEARIKVLQAKSVEFETNQIGKNENEPPISATLYSAILKNENFELVVQKATEIGIAIIQPITTDRTVKLNIRENRLQKIIREAAEQSGRGILPELHSPLPFKEAVKKSIDNDANFFFDQHMNIEHPHDVRIVDRAGIFIGPEGGWTDKEREIAEHFRFHFVNLGKLTLRAETAAIIASYLAMYGGVIE
jgi:16S rRNA (uracil1498-N3)-methyltransferase